MKILILPGLDGTAALLSEVAELLDSRHEVTAVRYPTDLHRYQDIETRVEASLPADEYIIVAESFSGPLAAMIASKNPSGLRGVVFVATFAKTPMKVPILLTYLVDIAPTQSRLFAQLAQPFLMGRWATPEFSTRFQQAMCAVPTSTIAGRLREILKVDVVKQLKDIAVPTIYLAAINDRLISLQMASDFDHPAHTTFEIEGPHFLLQANATESAKHILDFAARFD